MSEGAERRTRLRVLLALVGAAAISGCQQPGAGGPDSGIAYDPNSPGGPIVSMLATNAAAYARGAPISVRLTNRTGQSVGYNLCRARLERRGDDDVWRPMTESLSEPCTAELRTLRPGQSVTYTFRSAPRARPGQYRISTDLQDLSARLRFIGVSNTFALSSDGD